MKDLFLQIIKEGNKKIFSTWFVLLLACGCVLGAFLLNRAGSEYNKLKAEYDEYKEKTDGFERFVDYYPTEKFLSITLDSTTYVPYIIDMNQVQKWKGCDSTNTQVTIHGFTVDFSGLYTVRDTVWIDLENKKE